jgi:mannose-6-phosphate isomerase-like protein (cupin superfamily)
MRYVPMFCVFALLSGLSAKAQVLPAASGSCTVAASGVQGCNWVSAVSLRRATTSKPTDLASDSRSALVVTRFILAPGAPLDSQSIVGGEVLIVGRNNGEVINEKKSLPTHIDVYDGSVMLMPKEEAYLLRNVGKESTELLVIEVRK